MIKTEIGYTTVERIVVRGKDLADEIIGKMDFVDMIMFTHSGRLCGDAERAMINAILVTVTDHGLTPSALAARLTYLGAPEAPQAAVAAGLLGAGSVFLGSMENAAAMLADGARELPFDADDAQVAELARAMVATARAERRHIHGVGHPIHVKGDPRIPTLRALSEAHGYHGRHWRLMTAIEAALFEQRGKRLPLNAAGAIGAMVCDMGLPVSMARGLALIGRCAGLVAHLHEESANPTGQALWNLVLRQDPRNALPPSAK
jgi:citrate synthase